jgi:ATP-dependent RNA helicase DHX36
MIWYISVGETGSGKSTQCSNYILEDAIQAGKGGETSIMVTQPR